MVFVPVLSSNPPALVGQSKPLWSPDLLDTNTGAYPKTPLPSIAIYQRKTSAGDYQFFEYAKDSTPYTIVVGSDLFLPNIAEPLFPALGTNLQAEQSLWAVGKFTYGVYLYSEYWSGSQNSGGQDAYSHSYPVPNLATIGFTKVIIDNVCYDLLESEAVESSCLWAHTEHSEGPGAPQYDVFDAVTLTYALKIVGAPNLSSILSVGKVVYLTN